MRFESAKRNPTVIEYNHLRRLVGWPTYPDEVVEAALRNTLFATVILDESGVVIGMGRVLGDGAIYLHIQDVIVHPEYQRQGIGRMIMSDLMDYVQHKGGVNTNVGLMCSKGREKFYQDLGFIERPSEKFGSGMIMILQ